MDLAEPLGLEDKVDADNIAARWCVHRSCSTSVGGSRIEKLNVSLRCRIGAGLVCSSADGAVGRPRSTKAGGQWRATSPQAKRPCEIA
jgi:hypothetical protein